MVIGMTWHEYKKMTTKRRNHFIFEWCECAFSNIYLQLKPKDNEFFDLKLWEKKQTMFWLDRTLRLHTAYAKDRRNSASFSRRTTAIKVSDKAIYVGALH